jgi:hypothetical protein
MEIPDGGMAGEGENGETGRTSGEGNSEVSLVPNVLRDYLDLL